MINIAFTRSVSYFSLVKLLTNVYVVAYESARSLPKQPSTKEVDSDSRKPYISKSKRLAWFLETESILLPMVKEESICASLPLGSMGSLVSTLDSMIKKENGLGLFGLDDSNTESNLLPLVQDGKKCLGSCTITECEMPDTPPATPALGEEATLPTTEVNLVELDPLLQASSTSYLDDERVVLLADTVNWLLEHKEKLDIRRYDFKVGQFRHWESLAALCEDLDEHQLLAVSGETILLAMRLGATEITQEHFERGVAIVKRQKLVGE